MRFLIAAALAASTLAAPALAGPFIYAPTSATINSGGPGFGSINNTFNQISLSTGYTSGVTDFDTYIASNPQHTVIFSNAGGEVYEWFSNSGINTASVTYDLGSVLGISSLALWNEETSGIGVLGLFGSTDGLSFSSLGTFNPTDNGYTQLSDTYGADVFRFASTNARYVRFDMSGCPQQLSTNFNGCSIGEVAFGGTGITSVVPEPGTWALMITGFGFIGGALRRRRALGHSLA